MSKWLVCSLLFACDTALPPAVESAPLAAPSAVSKDVHDVDPLLVAIDAATALSSPGGIGVHDYEWGGIGYGVSRSRLSRDRMRDALDKLFVVAPHPSPYESLHLPRAFTLDAFAEAPTVDDWQETDLYHAEEVPALALPWQMRATLHDLVERVTGEGSAVMYLSVSVDRRRSDDRPYLVEAVLAESWCGWCQDGYRYFIGPDGTLLDERYEPGLAAFGYCC